MNLFQKKSVHVTPLLKILQRKSSLSIKSGGRTRSARPYLRDLVGPRYFYFFPLLCLDRACYSVHTGLLSVPWPSQEHVCFQAFALACLVRNTLPQHSCKANTPTSFISLIQRLSPTRLSLTTMLSITTYHGRCHHTSLAIPALFLLSPIVPPSNIFSIWLIYWGVYLFIICLCPYWNISCKRAGMFGVHDIFQVSRTIPGSSINTGWVLKQSLSSLNIGLFSLLYNKQHAWCLSWAPATRLLKLLEFPKAALLI